MSKPGRNDDCPCGSGKKFKHCHGQGKGAPATPAVRPAMPNPIEANQLIRLLNTRQFARAEEAAQSLITRYPTLGYVWKMRGLAQLMQGKNPLDSFSQAAMLSPNDADVHVNLANALHRVGRLQDAADSCQRALALEPDRVEAFNTLGNVLVDAGQLREAIDLYGRALAVQPGYVEAMCNLSNALGRTGDFSAALAVARRALDIRPTADVHSNLGHALRAQGDVQGALDSYQAALAMDPQHSVALVSAGVVLRDLGRLDEAAAQYVRALQSNPNDAEGYTQLGNLLQEMGRGPEAIEAFHRSLTLRPNDATTRLALTMGLQAIGRFADAQQWAERTLESVPNYAQVHVVAGHLAADRGDFGVADASYRRALQLDPDSVEACIGLGRYGASRFGEGWLENAERLSAKSQPLRFKVALQFAIGECHDLAGETDAAFAAWRIANEASKAYAINREPASSTAIVDRIMQIFDRQSLETPVVGANDSGLPVFVVGMPRSGTSLIEQILASHAAVVGAGETNFWMGAASEYQPSVSVDQMTEMPFKRFGDDYVQALQALAPQAARVIDKRPGNYLHLGLIHKALPNARIIHVQRDPLDTCLSIYAHNFATTHPYSVDLKLLAQAYQQYQTLMDHWRAVLPATTFLEVSYEALVHDPQGQTQRMLEFLELPWDPACLESHLTERVVLTPSKRQVREPIHTRAVGRASRYSSFLGDLAVLRTSV